MSELSSVLFVSSIFGAGYESIDREAIRHCLTDFLFSRLHHFHLSQLFSLLFLRFLCLFFYIIIGNLRTDIFRKTVY